MIIPKVFNFECHNLSFLGGYIPPESPTKLYDISRINDYVHEPVVGQIHHFFVGDWSHFFHRCEPVAKIDANQSYRTLRTPLRRNGVHQPWYWADNCTQIARFTGSTWGPPGSCRPQMGLKLAPWTLLSGKPFQKLTIPLIFVVICSTDVATWAARETAL